MTGLGTSGVDMLQKHCLPEQEQCLPAWHLWGHWLCSAGITGTGIPCRKGADLGQKMQCHIGDGSWLFGAPLFVHLGLLADKAKWQWEAAQRVGDMGSRDVVHDLSMWTKA